MLHIQTALIGLLCVVYAIEEDGDEPLEGVLVPISTLALRESFNDSGFITGTLGMLGLRYSTS